MPVRAPWLHRLAAVVAALAVTLGAQALFPSNAGAAGFVAISGSGSTWASNALDQWRRDLNNLEGMTVSFSPEGSSNGLSDFRDGRVDYAVSELPYSGSDGGVADPPPARAFGYLPIVAGGTAFMYNLTIGDKRVTNLRLSGEIIAKIFTQQITNWADPAIKADNPGLALPARPIVPVVRSDSAGPTAQLTDYLASQYPQIWDEYCHRAGRQPTPCGSTASYPLTGNIQAKAGSPGVAAFVAQDSSDGAITYVEYSYARNAGFPVVKMLNAAGYYVEPSAGNVALALLNAKVRPDLTHDLSQVYLDSDPRAYPLSSYSYLIIPQATTANFGPDSGRTLSELAYYAVCDGQQRADALGYSPLPINLVQAAADQINQIPGATGKIKGTDLSNCHNPALSPDGTDQLIKDVPQPQPCDRAAALTQCAGGTGGATAPTTATVTLAVSPAAPLAARTIETLTATIRPPAVAGSVQFKDGPGNVGGPVTVSGGTASTTTTLAPGPHSLTAVFTPANMPDRSDSTSPSVPAVVRAPAGAKATATTFMVIPSGPVIQGTPVILVAQVAPANAAGTVQFMDGDAELGPPRPVFGGFALAVTSKLAKGAHALTAIFTASNQDAFGPSTPPPVSLTVIGLS
ncbi:MAG TPA: substrate-binding domain-containing protein [Pseudonocardiaceae bacterium]|nr:substrate-binding domain-containing protein [Pseudonocardiaceae bacterium]